jgi:hypothetical protein
LTDSFSTITHAEQALTWKTSKIVKATQKWLSRRLFQIIIKEIHIEDPTVFSKIFVTLEQTNLNLFSV